MKIDRVEVSKTPAEVEGPKQARRLIVEAIQILEEQNRPDELCAELRAILRELDHLNIA